MPIFAIYIKPMAQEESSSQNNPLIDLEKKPQHQNLAYLIENKQVSEVIVVEQGFRFAALIFGVFWLLFHKMWRYSLIYSIIVMALPFLTRIVLTFLAIRLVPYISPESSSDFIIAASSLVNLFWGMAVTLFLGYNGSSLLERYLQAKECYPYNIIVADNAKDAHSLALAAPPLII